MTPLASIPAELTRTHRAALEALALADLHRVRNGYRGRGASVSLDTAVWLRRWGLARVIIDGNHKLSITGAGRHVLAAEEGRKLA